MRLEANLGLCQGYGNCVALDPDHLDLDDDGIVVVTRDTVLDHELEAVQAGIRSCPVNALKLNDQDASHEHS